MEPRLQDRFLDITHQLVKSCTCTHCHRIQSSWVLPPLHFTNRDRRRQSLLLALSRLPLYSKQDGRRVAASSSHSILNCQHTWWSRIRTRNNMNRTTLKVLAMNILSQRRWVIPHCPAFLNMPCKRSNTRLRTCTSRSTQQSNSPTTTHSKLQCQCICRNIPLHRSRLWPLSSHLRPPSLMKRPQVWLHMKVTEWYSTSRPQKFLSSTKRRRHSSISQRKVLCLRTRCLDCRRRPRDRKQVGTTIRLSMSEWLKVGFIRNSMVVILGRAMTTARRKRTRGPGSGNVAAADPSAAV